MPTARSRSVDDSRAKHFFAAADLEAGQYLVLEYPTPEAARHAYNSLRSFREKGKLAPKGTFTPSAIDPDGEGVGHFDHIEISYSHQRVRLGPPKRRFPEPAKAYVEGE